jgi:TolB protein
MRIVGLTVVLLLAGAAPGYSAFPGTNGLIAYTRTFEDRDEGSVEVAAPDGSASRVLVSSGSSPAWSSDGSRLLFQRLVGGHDLELFTVRADGTGLRRIRHPQRDDFLAAWSPDGRRIVFTSDVRGRNGISDAAEIFVVNADGSHLRRLTKNALEEDSPAWSPDGKRIAFARALSSGDAIIVTTAAGKKPVRLTTRPGDGAPSWSPDGNWIAFERFNYGIGADLNDADVFAIHPDGSGLHLVVGGPTVDFMPAWSPDGTKLAFSRGLDASDVYIANADGSEPVPLVTDAGDTFGPDWQPLR